MVLVAGRRMEIRQVPQVKCPNSSSSQRSHSSSSRGSLKGISPAGAPASGARKSSAGDEEKLPEPPPPERAAPPRPFLKTSFGQRLSAQCGSIFLDASTTKFQDNQAARAIPVASTSRADNNLEAGGENKNLRLTGNGNSYSASGRGSSGLSEVDVRGMALVAEAPALTRGGGGGGGGGSGGGGNYSALKLWGFAPGTIPKQKAIALVGQVAVAGKQAAELAQREASKRDGSPLGHASRAVLSSSVVKKEFDGIPKVEVENEEDLNDLPASEELQLARKDMISTVSASGRLSHKSLYGSSGVHVKSEADELLEGGKKETSMPRDDQLHRCSTEQLLHAVPPLSTATDSEAPTTANLSDHGNSTKRSSFKNDCGFLKLLPSKRKFSLEDHEASPTSQKPGAFVVENEAGGGMRMSSSKISRKSLLVHLSADKPTKSTGGGGGNEMNRESTNPIKERRGGACCEQLNSSGKPVVGSFMKWMIDVGKGLAKKRCFPAATEAVVPAPTSAPPAHQHQQQLSTDVSLLGSPVVGGTYNNSAAAASVKPSEDGRPISVSPQSCQNMDCTTEPEAVRHEENDENVSEMHTSGDEQLLLQAAAVVVSPRFENNINKTDNNVSNEGGGNSRNATEGTTRSVGPAEEHKGIVTPTTTATTTTTTTTTGLRAKIKHLQRHPLHGQEQEQVHDGKKGEGELGKQDEEDETVKKQGVIIVPEAAKLNRGEEASASFGMWQAASCLKGNQQHEAKKATAAQQKVTANAGATTTTTANKAARNVAAAAREGSGDGDESSQGMAEFVASMATVKSWVYNSFKCRESTTTTTNNNNSSSTRPCSFCGLRGHAVTDCSETLECELKELERRNMVLEGLSMEVRDFPCLRCLGMGHLGVQCRFSVTEAASRARENSELRNWKLSRRASNGGAHKATDNIFLCQQQSETVNLVTTNSVSLAAEGGNRKTHSPVDVPKRKDSPKENSGSFMKKVGGGLQRSSAGTPASKKKASLQSDAVPVVPKGMLAAVESLRLSRSELWRWMESPDFNSHIRGYFLRLRFGRWEKDLGGTGYRMARIRGGIRKEDKNMSVSVDLGDMECTVDSQYVSNHAFTEVELIEWWRGRWKAGKRLVTETELQNKLEHRQSL